MKLKLNVILAAGCILALTGCGIITPLPSVTYAELRLGDGDKRQLLIETDEWRPLLSAEGFGGNKHWTQAWFELQGDGPVYAINRDEGHGYNSVGTITIDQEHKHVALDLRHVPYGGGESTPFLYTGTYHLALITHEPFYPNDHMK
jgi:hypothetical protein